MHDLNEFLKKNFSEVKLLKILLINLIERLNSSETKIIPLFPQGRKKVIILELILDFLSKHQQCLEKIIINKKNQVG